MDSLITTIAQIKRLLPTLARMSQRRYGLQVGQVADIEDPLGKRRVKVEQGTQVSEWLVRFVLFPGFDPPLPRVGELIIYGYIDGDTDEGSGFWLGSLTNSQNPEDAQANPQGDCSWSVVGRRTDVVSGNYDVHGYGKIAIRNEAGAGIRLLPNGDIQLEDGFGNRKTLRDLSGVATPALESAMVED